ncbi:hypothetical protein Hte_002067 [Hypoxylon texense]
MPNLFALLVGVDLYLNDGSRKTKAGQVISLNSLHGCCNDVQIVQKVLRRSPKSLRVLTSTPSPGNPESPSEPEHCWPTFENIKRELDNVRKRARPRDEFLFYFSGHGARLTTTEGSPIGRSTDPSLITTDYGCGKPAVRGWQLNEWLIDLRKKNMRVTVILDCSYASGWWPNPFSVRTPHNWTPPENLPIDDVAALLASRKWTSNAKIEIPWDIQAEAYTFMIVWPTDTPVTDTTVHGKTTGKFTRELLKRLEEKPKSAISVYKNTYEQSGPLGEDLTIKETPGLGRRLSQRFPKRLSPPGLEVVTRHSRKAEYLDVDRYQDLDDPRLPLSPLWVRIQGAFTHLPMGKIHGVKKGEKFTTYGLGLTLRIVEVGNFKSKAKRIGNLPVFLGHKIRVFPCFRCSEEPLHIVVGPNTPRDYQDELYQALKLHIDSDIEILEDTEEQCSETGGLILRKQSADIFVPSSITGSDGPVRRLHISNQGSAQYVSNIAFALLHLFRFEQMLNLRSEASTEDPGYEVILKTKNNPRQQVVGQQAINYVFKNHTDSKLYLVVMALGPGWYVEQVYPGKGSAKEVQSYEESDFSTANVHHAEQGSQGLKAFLQRVDVPRDVQFFINLEDLRHVIEENTPGGIDAILIVTGSPQDAFVATVTQTMVSKAIKVAVRTTILSLKPLLIYDHQVTVRVWHQFFNGLNVAAGFPIPDRPEGMRSIEVLLDIMTALAGINGPIEYEDGFVLKGEKYALFPVAVDMRSRTMREASASLLILHMPVARPAFKLNVFYYLPYPHLSVRCPARPAFDSHTGT